VDDSFLMRGFKSSGDLAGNRHRFCERNRASSDALSQRLTFHKFHSNKIGTHVVKRADVWMIQPGDCPSFMFEPIAKLFGADLDCDGTAEASVGSLVDLAHAACAERSFYAVWTELRAWLQLSRHRSVVSGYYY
jgi:hypothetical protein